MVERWQGMVRGGVMASLIFCPNTRTLKKPSSNALLFMGDSASGTGDPSIERFSDLETIAAILLSKFEDPRVNTWVVEAPRFNGPFACYDAFVPSITPHGDPLCYDPQNLTASRAIVSLLHDCLAKVKQEIESKHKFSEEEEEEEEETKKEREDEKEQEVMQSIPRTLLFGFSKGGVVLNQLLSEIAFFEEQNRRIVDQNTQEQLQSEVLFPGSIRDLLKSIHEVHYIDVGLNCPGAYLTDKNILEKVVKFAASGSGSGSGPSLRIVFHGTPRQWKDRDRSWIAHEKETCITLLSMIAKTYGDKVWISEKLYFEGERPSLRMHFRILECFDMD